MVIFSCSCFRINGNRIWNKRVPYLIVWLAGTWTDGHTQNSVDIAFLNSFSLIHIDTLAHTERSKNGTIRAHIHHTPTFRRNGKLVNKTFSGFAAKRKVCVLSHATIGTVNGTSWLLKCYLTHKEDCHEQCVVYENFSQLYYSPILALALAHFSHSIALSRFASAFSTLCGMGFSALR